VANVSQSFYIQDGSKNQLAKLRHCHAMYTALAIASRVQKPPASDSVQCPLSEHGALSAVILTEICIAASAGGVHWRAQRPRHCTANQRSILHARRRRRRRKQLTRQSIDTGAPTVRVPSLIRPADDRYPSGGR